MKIWIETKASLALKKTGGKYILGDTREVKGEQMVIDTWYGFTRPNGLRENSEAEFSCGGPGPDKKKKYVDQYE